MKTRILLSAAFAALLAATAPASAPESPSAAPRGRAGAVNGDEQGREWRVVRILFVFESGAADYAGGVSRMEGFAQDAVAQMNTVLDNSGLGGNFQYEVAGVMQVDARQASVVAAYHSALRAAEGDEEADDGWEGVHAMRRETAADVVAALALASPAERRDGVARKLTADYLGDLASFADGPGAVCACSIEAVSREISEPGSPQTLSHYVAHTLGAGHSLADASPGPQSVEASCGLHYWDEEGAAYATVMAGTTAAYLDEEDETLADGRTARRKFTARTVPCFSGAEALATGGDGIPAIAFDNGNGHFSGACNNCLALLGTYMAASAWHMRVEQAGGAEFDEAPCVVRLETLATDGEYEIFYTTDGTDPRESETARLYAGEEEIDAESVVVKAFARRFGAGDVCVTGGVHTIVLGPPAEPPDEPDEPDLLQPYSLSLPAGETCAAWTAAGWTDSRGTGLLETHEWDWDPDASASIAGVTEAEIFAAGDDPDGWCEVTNDAPSRVVLTLSDSVALERLSVADADIDVVALSDLAGFEVESIDVAAGASLAVWAGVGAGDVEKSGAGTLRLNGVNEELEHDGDTTVAGGTLVLGAAHFGAGSYAVTSGRLVVNMPLDLDDGAELSVSTGGALEANEDIYAPALSASGARIVFGVNPGWAPLVTCGEARLDGATIAAVFADGPPEDDRLLLVSADSSVGEPSFEAPDGYFFETDGGDIYLVKAPVVHEVPGTVALAALGQSGVELDADGEWAVVGDAPMLFRPATAAEALTVAFDVVVQDGAGTLLGLYGQGGDGAEVPAATVAPGAHAVVAECGPGGLDVFSDGALVMHLDADALPDGAVALFAIGGAGDGAAESVAAGLKARNLTFVPGVFRDGTTCEARFATLNGKAASDVTENIALVRAFGLVPGAQDATFRIGSFSTETWRIVPEVSPAPLAGAVVVQGCADVADPEWSDVAAVEGGETASGAEIGAAARAAFRFFRLVLK